MKDNKKIINEKIESLKLCKYYNIIPEISELSNRLINDYPDIEPFSAYAYAVNEKIELIEKHIIEEYKKFNYFS